MSKCIQENRCDKRYIKPYTPKYIVFVDNFGQQCSNTFIRTQSFVLIKRLCFNKMLLNITKRLTINTINRYKNVISKQWTRQY